jgi:hypothetical protein
LEEKKKLGKQIPGQNLAVEKLKLCSKRDEYYSEGKMEKYHEICQEIRKIEEIIAKKDTMFKTPLVVDTSRTDLSFIPSANLSKVLEAFQDDVDEFGIKKKKEKYDAFSRRPTRSQGMYVQDVFVFVFNFLLFSMEI